MTAGPGTSSADEAALVAQGAAGRPPAWIGVVLLLAPAALLGTGVVVGVDVTGGLATASFLTMAGGVIEASRSLEGWSMARRTRAHGIVVERGVLGPTVLRLPWRAGATAVRAQQLFAATNDLLWRVSVPLPDGATFRVTRRGLLSGGGIAIDDADFAAELCVDSDDDATAVRSRLPPHVRRALTTLFRETAARRVRCNKRELVVDFPRRGSDLDPLLRALPLVRALVDALDQRPGLPPDAGRSDERPASSLSSRR